MSRIRMHRRTALTAIGTVGLSGLAGCLSFVRGEEPLEVAAGSVRVPDDVREEVGYEFVGRDDVTLDREFEVAGQSREVIVTNTQAEYEKALDLEPVGSTEAAVFTGLATPSVSVLGREFNPVDEMSTRELAEMVQDQYDEIEDISHVEDETVDINGESTTVSIYTAEATLLGDLLDIYLHVSEAVDFDDDLVIAVGAYPEIIPEEADNIRTLMNALEADD